MNPMWSREISYFLEELGAQANPSVLMAESMCIEFGHSSRLYLEAVGSQLLCGLIKKVPAYQQSSVLEQVMCRIFAQPQKGFQLQAAAKGDRDVMVLARIEESQVSRDVLLNIVNNGLELLSH